MFGYLTLNGRDLSPENRKRYEGFYCGLCRTLNERYGAQGRVTLSNDMTFLLMLLTSLYEPEEKRRERFCVLHPVRRRATVESEWNAYAADMNVLLAYYKCLDDWRDDRSAAARLQARLLKRGYDAIEARYPAKCAAVRRALDDIRAVEERNEMDVDAAANLTGLIMGEIYACRDDCWQAPLRAMGEAMGRFVYVMDAYDDLPADIRKNAYNPLRPYLAQEEHEQFFADSLTMLMSECADAFEMLPLVQDAELMRNILYSGVWGRYARRRDMRSRRDSRAGKERSR